MGENLEMGKNRAMGVSETNDGKTMDGVNRPGRPWGKEMDGM